MQMNRFTRFCDDPEITCCRAEKELEQLQRELSRFHEDNRWISTHERFPEKGQRCLIYPVDGKSEVAYLENGKFVFWDGACTDANKITHWIPLPVLPEEVES